MASRPHERQMELHTERYEWVEVRGKSYESECHDMCLVVCQMWGEVIVLVFLFHLRRFSVNIYAQRTDLFKLRQSAETMRVDSLATAAY